MDCPHCDSSTITERSDLTTRGYRRFRCRSCGRGFNERTHSHFNRSLCVIQAAMRQRPSSMISLM
jgi:transposase-like protein